MPSEYISVSIAFAPCSTCSGCTRIGSPISNVTVGMPASLAGASQRAALADTVEHDRRAERLRHALDLRYAQVGAHLRQVGAIQRARVQVDHRGAVLHDVGEERMRHARGGAAARVAGK
jgi:hypothetical protein